jgi:hypothetical protein
LTMVTFAFSLPPRPIVPKSRGVVGTLVLVWALTAALVAMRMKRNIAQKGVKLGLILKLISILLP